MNVAEISSFELARATHLTDNIWIVDYLLRRHKRRN